MALVAQTERVRHDMETLGYAVCDLTQDFPEGFFAHAAEQCASVLNKKWCERLGIPDEYNFFPLDRRNDWAWVEKKRQAYLTDHEVLQKHGLDAVEAAKKWSVGFRKYLSNKDGMSKEISTYNLSVQQEIQEKVRPLFAAAYSAGRDPVQPDELTQHWERFGITGDTTGKSGGARSDHWDCSWFKQPCARPWDCATAFPHESLGVAPSRVQGVVCLSGYSETVVWEKMHTAKRFKEVVDAMPGAWDKLQRSPLALTTKAIKVASAVGCWRRTIRVKPGQMLLWNVACAHANVALPEKDIAGNPTTMRVVQYVNYALRGDGPLVAPEVVAVGNHGHHCASGARMVSKAPPCLTPSTRSRSWFASSVGEDTGAREPPHVEFPADQYK